MPKLVIIKAGPDPASAAYVGTKQRYGADIGVEVEVYDIDPRKVVTIIQHLNNDPTVHGIIVQLPLPESLNAYGVLNSIDPSKDIDGLGKDSKFEAPTPTAILWLLNDYKIDLSDKQIAVVGQGRLVGIPLTRLLKAKNYSVETYDDQSKNIQNHLKKADVVITATGQPGLVKGDMIKPGAVIIDAGTAEAGDKLVGDVDPEIYKRGDIKVSPVPGGVGPLTVCALFANLIKATKTI